MKDKIKEILNPNCYYKRERKKQCPSFDVGEIMFDACEECGRKCALIQTLFGEEVEALCAEYLKVEVEE